MKLQPLTDRQWESILEFFNWSPKSKIRGTPRADFHKVWNLILWILITRSR